MLDGILEQLNVSSKAINFKDLGTTKAKIKSLVDMGLVDYHIIQNAKGTLKSPNSAIITDKGKELLMAMKGQDFSLPTAISQIKAEIAEVHNILNTVQDYYKGISQSLMSISARISALESGGGEADDDPGEDVTLHYSRVLNAYFTFKDEISGEAPVGKVIDHLHVSENIKKSSIKRQLLDYFSKSRVQLVEGESDVVIDGSEGQKFAFIKIG